MKTILKIRFKLAMPVLWIGGFIVRIGMKIGGPSIQRLRDKVEEHAKEIKEEL